MRKGKIRKVQLNDVVLREGDQVEGGKMSPRDQISYIDLLIEGGVDRIEVGYPGSSDEQLERCKQLVEYVRTFPVKKQPLLSGLSPAQKDKIDAVKETGCDICHIYIPASNEFIEAMFDKEEYGDTLEGKQNWVIDTAVRMVKYAKKIGFKHIQYSPEDAARSDKKFVCRVIKAVIDAGATVINVPDTTGLRILNEFGDLIKYIRKNVVNISKALISVHIHNDSDNSTNNALQAILAGADIVEGTFYGIGERAGMTKFEAVIMNINTRRDIFSNIEISFKTELCYPLVHNVANALGMPIPRHWVVVGAQNTICSSGTHQAIEAKAKDKSQGYYSWNPELYGHCDVETVINQSSGRSGIVKILKGMGYKNIKKNEMDEIYERAMKISDSKGGEKIDPKDLNAIVRDVLADIPYQINIGQSQVLSGKGTMPVAVVIASANDMKVKKAGLANGPNEALMDAVRKCATCFYAEELTGVEIVLDHMGFTPITSGIDSLGDFYTRIKFIKDDEMVIFSGRAVDEDVGHAASQSIANCFSWYVDHVKNMNVIH